MPGPVGVMGGISPENLRISSLATSRKVIRVSNISYSTAAVLCHITAWGWNVQF